MKRNKSNAGYTLIEVLVAISILGILVVPTCNNLIMSLRVNEKTDDMLHAQLAVSSVVETLMAEGIGWESYIAESGSAMGYGMGVYDVVCQNHTTDPDHACFVTVVDRFEDVMVQTKRVSGKPYYEVTVTHVEFPEIKVTTHIRAVTFNTIPATPVGGTS